MMKQETLFSKFNQAIAWNSVLYFVTRISKTIISFLLFRKLTTTDFAAWANIFSLVFITTLWLDFGMRFSIPRYCPEFAKNTRIKKRFITKVLSIYALFLIGVNGILVFYAPSIASLFKLSSHLAFFYAGCLLFFIESIKSILRLIFYAHFWQKQFNLLETSLICVSTIGLLVVSALKTESFSLLNILFGAEILSSTLIVCVAFIMLRYLYKDPEYQDNQPINVAHLTKEFITHSGVMWLFVAIASLTERNVLIPFFSLIFGHTASNLFKVANDGALVCARFVILVVAIPGRVMLSHVEADLVEPKRHLFINAFKHLNKRVMLFTIPLLISSIIVFSYLSFYTIKSSYEVVRVAALLIFFYMANLIFLAYEQVLEVKRNYKELFISFIPYIGIIVTFIFFRQSLLTLLVIIHSLKILSTIMRVYFAQKKYRLPPPGRV